MNASVARKAEGFEGTLLAEAERHCLGLREDDAITRLAQSAGGKARFWSLLWSWALVRESVITSRLIETCPDLDARVRVFGVIQREYGYPQAGRSHTQLLRDFLLALGVPGETCAWPLRRGAPEIQAEIARIDGLGFVGCIAYGLIGWGAFAKNVLPAVKQRLLKSDLGLTAGQVSYFDEIASYGGVALEAGVELVARYAVSPEDRERAVEALRSFFVHCPACQTEQGRGPGRVSALPPDAFEQQLREICDRAYQRPSRPDNPMFKLMRGDLTLDEARRFWGRRWNLVLLLNQHILPHLLRTCPDLESRTALWRSVSVEYGAGRVEESHPILFRRFLVALGTPEETYPLQLPAGDPDIAERIRRIESGSWLESLGRFLGRETVGPKVFPMIETALARSFKLSAHDLAWFSVHGTQDRDDADDVFALAVRHARTAEEQETVRRGLRQWFEDSPEYCCALGPMDYQYVRQRT